MRYLVDAFPIRLRGPWLVSLARSLTLRFGLTRDISIAVVSQSEMKRLNTVYRGKKKSTDVLSFSFLSAKGITKRKRKKVTTAMMDTMEPAGEIILCLETVREKAKERDRSFEDELKALVVHATLHIMGYDHEREYQAKAMESLEKRIGASLARSLAKT